MSVTLTTLVNQWGRVRTTNATDSSFPSRISTITTPASDGVIGNASGVGQVPNNLSLIFFGAGSDNDTFSARVIGWAKGNTLWLPTILTQLDCTLSTAVGVAGTDVLDTERFADTIAIASGFGSDGVNVRPLSPANNTIAHVVVDLEGHALWEVTFDMTGATSGNALYRWF